MTNQEKVTDNKTIYVYMHKNNKLRTHFYDKYTWLLHPGYYILNDVFLKINE